MNFKTMTIELGNIATMLILMIFNFALISNAEPIIGRWPSLNDGSPSSRRSPINRISNQKNDERHGWQWTRVETTNRWHWQHDVKIEDDNISKAVHGNKDNHRLQVGEPAVIRTGSGSYRLEFYIKHDRAGDNPIMFFTVILQNGEVVSVESQNIRGAGALSDLGVNLLRKGINIGADSAISWATGGIATAYGSAWKVLDWIFPEDWLHQYKGWQLDAFWFASQVGYLYARALPQN